jgi:hypothetical protein
LYTDGGARITKDLFVSGTTYLTNLTVYGTASVQYITSSQINVGANIIYLNTQTPAVRYGGMAVADSGSNAGVTGSMLWDSVNNGWIYTRESGSTYSGGALISGPRSSVQGSEQGTTNNALMKGQGGDHITSSQMIDDGTTVQIPGNLQVTGSIVGSSTVTATNGLLIGNGGATATSGYVPKFTGTSTIGNSTMQDDGTNVSITGGFTANSFLRVFKNGSDSLGSGPFMALYNAGATAAIFQQLNASNGLDWWTTFGKLMTLTSTGNLGLGVTPSAWGSGYIALQIPSGTYGGGSFLSDNGSPAISANAYNNAGWKYVNTDFATIYQSRSGQHQWFTAPSGTAGVAITFTQAMTLNASGNLSIGNTNDTFKLDVSGTARLVNNGISTAFGDASSFVLNSVKSTLTASQTVAILIGKANSLNNQMTLLYNHVNDGSTSNYLGLGFYGQDNLFKLYATGEATFSSSVGISSGTGTNLTYYLTPSGWNGAKHRFGVPVSGDASILSFNWSGTARDYVGYGSSVIGLSDGTITLGVGSGANPTTRLTIASTGAATFSSSVTATTAILQSANTAAVVDILLLTNPSAASSGVRQRFANGYGDLAAIKVSQRDNGALADDGQIEFQVASNSALDTKLTILNTGAATFSGNVGIGIAPTNQLHLYKASGTVSMTLQTNNLYGYFYNDGTNIGLASDSGTTGLKLIVSRTAPDSTFVIASTGAATFSSTIQAVNQVKIFDGAYLSAYATSLRTATGAVGVLQLGNNNDNYILAGNSGTGGYLDIRVNCASESITAGTLALRINTSGAATFYNTLEATNIGIGNAPTSTKLFANQTTAGEWIATFKNYGTTNAYGVSIDMSGSTSSQSAFQVYTAAGNGIRVLNSNGGLLVGTFTDISGKLVVKQPYTSATTPIYFGNTSFTAWNRNSYDTMILQQDDVTSFRMVEKNGEANTSDQVLCFSIGDGSATIATSAQPLKFFVNGSPTGVTYQGLSGTLALTLQTNGSALFGSDIVASGDITAYSDISVKENIRPIENALQRVTKSRGVLYDRIDSDTKNNIGFIAQELELEFPELISVNADGTKGVKYQNAVAILFEAIKEQQTQIEELKTLVYALTK